MATEPYGRQDAISWSARQGQAGSHLSVVVNNNDKAC